MLILEKKTDPFLTYLPRKFNRDRIVFSTNSTETNTYAYAKE